MTRTTLVLALAAAGAIWTGVRAQQEVRPTPGPGSGTITVRGTVDIGSMPDMAVAQRGPWSVAITNAPPLVLSTPSFVRKGTRYRITWANGSTQVVAVLDRGDGGWVQVEAPDGGVQGRWVNLQAAREIEELR